MPNPLFNQFNNNANTGNIQNFIQQVRSFKSTFTGNPREEVQRLLNSGQMSQGDFNRYAQIAQQVVRMMGE